VLSDRCTDGVQAEFFHVRLASHAGKHPVHFDTPVARADPQFAIRSFADLGGMTQPQGHLLADDIEGGFDDLGVGKPADGLLNIDANHLAAKTLE